MNDSLNVLVLENEPGAADMARDELEAAGHVVHSCHDRSATAFPCAALRAGGGCPLDAAPIDVALDVRRHARSQPVPLEDGVTCALRHHIPLVVAGPTVLNPFENYATEVLDRPFGVVEACERVATSPLAEHTAAAQAVLDEISARYELSTPRVVVHRGGGRMTVTISGADDFHPQLRGIIATRMTGAVRSVDRYARHVDVMFG